MVGDADRHEKIVARKLVEITADGASNPSINGDHSTAMELPQRPRIRIHRLGKRQAHPIVTRAVEALQWRTLIGCLVEVDPLSNAAAVTHDDERADAGIAAAGDRFTQCVQP